jgi:hypothetical protein
MVGRMLRFGVDDRIHSGIVGDNLFFVEAAVIFFGNTTSEAPHLPLSLEREIERSRDRDNLYLNTPHNNICFIF